MLVKGATWSDSVVEFQWYIHMYLLATDYTTTALLKKTEPCVYFVEHIASLYGLYG